MHCIVLHIFIFAFFISFIAFKKRKEKLKFFEKYKNIVYVYTGTCLPLDGH